MKSWKKYLTEATRIILGIVFLLSGIGKVIDNKNAIYLVELMATELFWLVEWRYEVVYLTIFIELVLAVLFLGGWKLKPTYIFTFFFLSFFTGVVTFFYLEGFDVASCGCFGAFGFSGGLEATLIRNIILLILIVTGFTIELKRTNSNKI